MIISKEERAKLHRKHSLGPGGVFYAAQYHDAIADIERLLNALEVAERTNTMPCPHCDFASGQRGMDRCSRCDGTGRVSVVPELIADRDAWKARAERLQAKQKLLIAILAEQDCPYEEGQCIKTTDPRPVTGNTVSSMLAGMAGKELRRGRAS